MKKTTNYLRYFGLSFYCFLCWTCTLPDLPPEKKLLGCQKPTGISAIVDAQNPKKYSFALVGNLQDVANVVYTLNSATIANNYTFTADGSFTVSALITSNCQESFTLTNTITINTKPDILSGGFTLTDPKVLSNAQTLAITNKGEIVTNDDNIVKVWNLQTNTLVRSFNTNLGIPNAIALTPDEKYLFIAAPNLYINQYDFSTGGFIKQINAHTSSISDLVISGDGKTLVSSSYDKTVKTWDVSTGNLLKSITVDNSTNSAYIYKLAINYDGSKVVGAFLRNNGSPTVYEIVVLNATTGAEIFRFPQNNYVYDIAIDKIGKFVYANSSNSQTKVIDLETKLTTKEFNSNPSALAISPDDKYIATGEQLFSTSNYTQSWYKFRHFYFGASNVAFSSNGNYIGTISRNEGTIALVTLDGTETKQNRLGHEGLITSINYSKDGNNAVIFDATGKVKYWDLATKSEKYTILTGGYTNSSLMNENSIAGGYFNSFKVWNKINGTIKYSIPLNSPVETITSSPDNKFYVVSFINGENKIFEAETGKTLFSLIGGTTYPIFTGVSPDSKRIISFAYDRKIRIWDATNGAVIKTLDISSLVNNSTDIYTTTLSTDGNNLAISYYDGAYKILNYSIALESRISQFTINAYIISLDFSKDGQNIVVGNNRNTVQIYNVLTGILQKERAFSNYIVNVAYNPSGTQIYVTTNKDFQIISAK